MVFDSQWSDIWLSTPLFTLLACQPCHFLFAGGAVETPIVSNPVDSSLSIKKPTINFSEYLQTTMRAA